MVDGATSRKVATSRVVHQSRGSGSFTEIRLQRSRCLIATGVFEPDPRDRDSPISRFDYHVGGTAVSAGSKIPAVQVGSHSSDRSARRGRGRRASQAVSGVVQICY